MRWKMKLKGMLALALAVIMMMPANLSALASTETEEGGNERWKLGNTSTLSGNQKDGWQLEFYENGSGEGVVTSYTADIDVSNLQVKFNMADCANNTMFRFYLGEPGKSVLDSNTAKAEFVIEKIGESGGRMCYRLAERKSDGALQYRDLYFSGKDDTGDHIFQFVKENNRWVATLADAETNNNDQGLDYSEFMNTMEEKSPQKTTVSWWPVGGQTTVIKNINFFGKNDLTGWTLNGATALTGNPQDGWQLSLPGDVWQNHTAVYETAIDVSKLQMHFNLSEMPEGSNLRVQFGDKAYNFNYNTNASMNLVLENFDNKNLRMYGYKNDTVIGLKDMEFDFTKDHVLEFVQENGNWVPAVDGAAIGTDASFNTFIETMSTTSAGKTTVRFYEAAANGTYVIKNINFSENTDDLTGWTVGATSTMTGNPTDGWKIDFYGVRDVSYGTSYAAGIDVSKLQVKFNLSDLPTGKSIVLQLGKEKGSFEAEDTTRVNFALERIADNKLRFNGYDGNRYTSVVYNLHDFDFNYNENHVLTFEQQDGKWLPAIDGTIQIWPDNPSDIEAYDTFVRTMMTESAGQTVVSFAPNDAYGAKLTVKNINFTEKNDDLDSDWDISNKGMIQVNGTAEDGYTFAVDKEQEGSGSVLYKKPVDFRKQAIEFIYAPEDGDWSYIYLKSASLGYPQIQTDYADIEGWGGLHDGERKKMTLRFDRDGDNLKVAYWFGWAPEGQGLYTVLGTVKDFDWTKTHTMSFVQNQTTFGWNLMIDDILLEEGNGSEAQSWFNANLNNYEQDGGVYVQIGARGVNGQKALFDTVKFVENTKNDPEKPETSKDWNCTNVVAVGDNENGYRLAGQSGLGTAYYKKRMKPDQTEIEFRVNVSDGWGYISLSEDPDMSLLAGNDELKEKNGMIILLERKGTLLNLQLYAKDTVISLASYENFDFGAKHTISFVREWGSWYMVFDGEVLRKCRLNDYLFEQLVKAREGLYYRFSAYFAPFAFKDLRFRQTAGSDLNTEYDWEISGYVPEGSDDNATFKGTGIAVYKKLVDLNNTTIRAQIKPEQDSWQCIQLSDIMSSNERVCPRLTIPTDGTLTLIFGRQERACRVSLYGTLEDGTAAEVLIGHIEAFDWEAVHDIRFVDKNGTWHIVIDNQSFEYIRYNENTYVTDTISEYFNRRNGKVYVRFSDAWVGQNYTWGNVSFLEGAYVEPAVDAWLKMTTTETGNGWTLSGEGNVGFTRKFDFSKDALKFKTKPEIDSWTGINFGNTYNSGLSILQGVDNPYSMLTLIFARNSESALRFSLYDGEKEIALAYIADFDFDQEHTLCFEKRKGNWYLNIDGRTLEGLNRDSDGMAAAWIRKATKLLDGSAYVRIGTPGFTSQTITGVQFVNKTQQRFEIPEAPKKITKAETEKKPEEKPEKKPEDTEPVVQPEPTEESSIHMTVVLAVLGVLAALAVGAVVILLVLGRKKKKEECLR